MTVLPKDPLLAAARIIIIVVMAVLGLAATALVVAAGYVAIDPAGLAAEFANEGLAAPDGRMIAAILTIILLALIALALIALFLLNLLRVVDSVGAGDPFAPVNAERLARMGWLMLAVQLVPLAIGALAAWIGRRVDLGDVDVGISADGIVLALVLFILARVFRQGAAMREDLEGTV